MSRSRKLLRLAPIPPRAALRHQPFETGNQESQRSRITLRSYRALTIRSFLPRVFGGALAVAPARARGSPRRLLATMATETASSAPAQTEGAAPVNGGKTKLHGRAFYESIGSPKLILAPMVEQSEFVCFVKSLSGHGITDNTALRHGGCSLDPSCPPRSSRIC